MYCRSVFFKGFSFRFCSKRVNRDYNDDNNEKRSDDLCMHWKRATSVSVFPQIWSDDMSVLQQCGSRGLNSTVRLSVTVISSALCSNDRYHDLKKPTALWVVIMDVISEILTGVLKFKSKFLPILATQGRRRSGSKAPLILNLCATWRWLVRSTPLQL
jgi:hypothetical protein